MIQNVDLLWRHRYKSRSPALLWRHNDRLFPRGYYGRFLSTMMLRTVILFCDPRVSTRRIASYYYYYYLYHNYEKYPLSPLKPRFLVLIEQYLPNISDPVYLVHQSFMRFLWLNWGKSTFCPVTAPNDSKCWPIVTSSIQEPAASNCDITMTDCSRVVAMDAFLEQWCWGQWFKEFDQIVVIFVHWKCDLCIFPLL